MAARTHEPPWVLLLFLALAFTRREPSWWKGQPKGRGAGPGATTAPVPAGGANVWSEQTMRLFVSEMLRVPIAPELVLLAIAAASNFDATTELGNNVGLLMLRRDDLKEVGYPDVVPFESLTAPKQIPWIARVISYRLANTGDVVMSVPDLAVLLAHVAGGPNVERVIRAEAERRSERAKGTMLYIHHQQLLQSVR